MDARLKKALERATNEAMQDNKSELAATYWLALVLGSLDEYDELVKANEKLDEANAELDRIYAKTVSIDSNLLKLFNTVNTYLPKINFLETIDGKLARLTILQDRIESTNTKLDSVVAAIGTTNSKLDQLIAK